MADIWEGVRWEYLNNVDGVGATGTGTVISSPCRLFEVRGVAYSAISRMNLYDHTNRPQNPILALNPSLGTPDIGWRKEVTLQLRRGLYVSFSMGTGPMELWAGWER